MPYNSGTVGEEGEEADAVREWRERRGNEWRDGGDETSSEMERKQMERESGMRGEETSEEREGDERRGEETSGLREKEGNERRERGS